MQSLVGSSPSSSSSGRQLIDNDCLSIVVSYLDLKSLLSASVVCKQWKRVSEAHGVIYELTASEDLPRMQRLVDRFGRRVRSLAVFSPMPCPAVRSDFLKHLVMMISRTPTGQVIYPHISVIIAIPHLESIVVNRAYYEVLGIPNVTVLNE